MWLLRFTLTLYPTRRVVPSINTPYVPLRTQFYYYELLTTYSWLHWVPCTSLFFPVLRGLVKRSMWGPLIHALRLPIRLHQFVSISLGLWFCSHSVIESKPSRFRCLSLCRLVVSTPDRGSVIVQRSSRSSLWCLYPHHLIASNLFSRMKLFTCYFEQVIWYETYCPMTSLAMVPITSSPRPWCSPPILCPCRLEVRMQKYILFRTLLILFFFPM
jgi:hypothetical protein